MNNRYTALTADCAKIASRANREAVDYIIDAARINANDTVHAEKAQPESAWDSIFTGTIASILCDGGHDRHVVAFFTSRGISF